MCLDRARFVRLVFPSDGTAEGARVRFGERASRGVLIVTVDPVWILFLHEVFADVFLTLEAFGFLNGVFWLLFYVSPFRFRGVVGAARSLLKRRIFTIKRQGRPNLVRNSVVLVPRVLLKCDPARVLLIRYRKFRRFLAY